MITNFKIKKGADSKSRAPSEALQSPFFVVGTEGRSQVFFDLVRRKVPVGNVTAELADVGEKQTKKVLVHQLPRPVVRQHSVPLHVPQKELQVAVTVSLVTKRLIHIVMGQIRPMRRTRHEIERSEPVQLIRNANGREKRRIVHKVVVPLSVMNHSINNSMATLFGERTVPQQVMDVTGHSARGYNLIFQQGTSVHIVKPRRNPKLYGVNIGHMWKDLVSQPFHSPYMNRGMSAGHIRCLIQRLQFGNQLFVKSHNNLSVFRFPVQATPFASAKSLLFLKEKVS